MKLAVVGKGGVGKTSISGTLARLLARRGHRVLAVDGDPNPNLALSLGISPERVARMPGLGRELVERTDQGLRLARSLEEVCADYAVPAPDGVTLLAMRPEAHANVGCLGAVHFTVRNIVALAPEAPGEICLLDIEASLEHFRQNKALHADTMLIVVEPYFKSLETARRMIGLARQLEPERLVLVANKVHGEDGRAAVDELAAEMGVEVAGAVPHDPRLLEADIAGRALLDYAPDAPAVTAIGELADELLSRHAPPQVEPAPA